MLGDQPGKPRSCRCGHAVQQQLTRCRAPPLRYSAAAAIVGSRAWCAKSSHSNVEGAAAGSSARRAGRVAGVHPRDLVEKGTRFETLVVIVDHQPFGLRPAPGINRASIQLRRLAGKPARSTTGVARATGQALPRTKSLHGSNIAIAQHTPRIACVDLVEVERLDQPVDRWSSALARAWVRERTQGPIIASISATQHCARPRNHKSRSAERGAMFGE